MMLNIRYVKIILQNSSVVCFYDENSARKFYSSYIFLPSGLFQNLLLRKPHITFHGKSIPILIQAQFF
jgi:hypothetical protein